MAQAKKAKRKKAASKGGRPLVLTAAKKKIVIGLIEEGASRNLAAAHEGIATKTIASEMERDEEFLHGIKKAEAKCEMFHIRRIRRGDTRWQSSAWFLERKWPDKWLEKKDDAACMLEALMRAAHKGQSE